MRVWEESDEGEGSQGCLREGIQRECAVHLQAEFPRHFPVMPPHLLLRVELTILLPLPPQ